MNECRECEILRARLAEIKSAAKELLGTLDAHATGSFGEPEDKLAELIGGDVLRGKA